MIKLNLFPTFPHQKLCNHKFPFVDLYENIFGLYCRERNCWIKGYAYVKLTKYHQISQQNGLCVPVFPPATCESSVVIDLHLVLSSFLFFFILMVIKLTSYSYFNLYFCLLMNSNICPYDF